jgi:hypothetical protein
VEQVTQKNLAWSGARRLHLCYRRRKRASLGGGDRVVQPMAESSSFEKERKRETERDRETKRDEEEERGVFFCFFLFNT